MTGYLYGELAPTTKCPYCGATCHADFVDVGVGFIQCGPYHCERCRASEIGPNDEPRQLTQLEDECGWYGPHSEPGSSANVDDGGNIITHYEADTLYRTKAGVAPRYTKNGSLIRKVQP